MVILTKASQQPQNVVEIQKNWIVSFFAQNRANTRILKISKKRIFKRYEPLQITLHGL